MPITLARIDDRVIHGQTITRWASMRPVNSLIVISDAVANDELRIKVTKSAAQGYKVGIYTVEQGVDALKKVAASSKDFFIISDGVEAFAELARRGADFGSTLNIGNYNGHREGAVDLGRCVSLTSAEREAFDFLSTRGIDLQFQLLPDDPIRTWDSIRAKFDELA